MKNTLFNQRKSKLCAHTQKYLASVSAVCLLFLVLSGCTACNLDNPSALISGNGYSLQVELAMSEESRRCGLSMRDRLEPDHGMLFVFDQDQTLSFWMKDTRIPLSIAYLTAEGKILNIHAMKPMNTELRYPSVGRARYALEVNQGWFSHHQLKSGDHIQLPLEQIK